VLLLQGAQLQRQGRWCAARHASGSAPSSAARCSSTRLRLPRGAGRVPCLSCLARSRLACGRRRRPHRRTRLALGHGSRALSSSRLSHLDLEAFAPAPARPLRPRSQTLVVAPTRTYAPRRPRAPPPRSLLARSQAASHAQQPLSVVCSSLFARHRIALSAALASALLPLART
jgi:hypothetical protein